MVHTPPAKREEAIFEIVSQLNRGAALHHLTERNVTPAPRQPDGGGARQDCDGLCCGAGGYSAAGRALLAEDSWERQYRLTFDLDRQQAECEFLTGERAAAAARLVALAGHATTLVDKATVTRLRVVLYTTLGQFDLAIEVGRDYSRPVGLAWPRHPTGRTSARNVSGCGNCSIADPIEHLLDLPVTTSPEWRATMDVFMDLVPCSVH